MGSLPEAVSGHSDNRSVTQTLKFFYRKREGCWVSKSHNAKLFVFDHEKTFDGGIMFRTLRMVPIEGMGALPVGTMIIRYYKGWIVFSMGIPLSRKAPEAMLKLIQLQDEHSG
jgi:hypothetical protein